MPVNLRSLVGKLNPVCRTALDGAAGLCLARTHYDVEIEHFLMKLLDTTDGDVTQIFKHFGINRSRIADDLARGLDRIKSGNARTPALSPSLLKMFTEAWTLGSIEFAAPQVRSGHCLLALVSNEELARMAKDISKEFDKIAAEAMRKDFDAITALSSEAAAPTELLSSNESSSAGSAPRPAGKGATPNLDQFTVDLTARAKEGKIDPVLGRDIEVRQVVDILTRRRQNNPILVGEAGVGKTAVVEGFARRIVEGDVPEPLRNVSLRSLDLALLQAGAGIKGEFEDRLKKLIEEVKNSATARSLLLDEAHTMIGAGGQAGQNDAANLLKPALARGELRTVAATTWAEYKKFFEKDPALSRRFQLVKVEEPDEDRCLVMLRGVVPALEKHHKVRITDDGLDAAVRLSHRYLPDRQLPDKAVSVLDTACARLALGQQATPPAIEDAHRQLDDIAVQTRVLGRESALGIDHGERLNNLAARRAQLESDLADLKTRWESERGLVDQVRKLREQIEAAHAGDGKSQGNGDGKTTDTGAPSENGESLDSLRAKLGDLTGQLDAVQGEKPLMRVAVDASIVGEVISGWTGVPVGKMLRDQLGMMLELERLMGSRIIGQDHALEMISRRIRTSAARIEDPNKPKGVFMLVGPSGVGKTETALAMSDLLFGGEGNIITINMSEFQEPHTVSTLKGSPPGYVGYGEGGVLTEAVRRRPYSVVLLDEVEKAHPDVLELFFQVFDKRVMEDGEGREIDFRNSVILLTTNAGTDTIMTLTADPETAPSMEGLAKALKPELDKVFKPAFLGRMVVIPYYPVRDENLKKIIRLKLGKVTRRLAETHRVTLAYDDTLVDAVAARCTEVESGARNVDYILTNTMLPTVSRMLLEPFASGTKPGTITVTVDDAGELAYDLAPVASGASYSLGGVPAAATA